MGKTIETHCLKPRGVWLQGPRIFAIEDVISTGKRGRERTSGDIYLLFPGWLGKRFFPARAGSQPGLAASIV